MISKRRKGRYLETWRQDDTGAWKCILEIQSPLGMPGGPDLRPGLEFEDMTLQAAPGNEAAGKLTPAGPPLHPVRLDAGKSCIVEIRRAYTISGTLSGSVEIDYRILIAGPCDLPPGTYDEEWIAHGNFSGNVNGTPASGNLSCVANVKAGGEVNGRIVLGQGLKGELRVYGNFKDGKLSYEGWVE